VTAGFDDRPVDIRVIEENILERRLSIGLPCAHRTAVFNYITTLNSGVREPRYQQAISRVRVVTASSQWDAVFALWLGPGFEGVWNGEIFDPIIGNEVSSQPANSLRRSPGR
jgi:hypothetical protein